MRYESHFMTTYGEMIHASQIQNLITTIQISLMIDLDLATVYGVEVNAFYQAASRNIECFLNNFRFEISDEEKAVPITIRDHFEPLKYSMVYYYVYAERGISMFSAVMSSDTDIKVSIRIMNAYIQILRFIRDNAKVLLPLQHRLEIEAIFLNSF